MGRPGGLGARPGGAPSNGLMPPPPPSAALNMAPSNLFLASTGPGGAAPKRKSLSSLGGQQMKPKIKLGGGHGSIKLHRPPGSGGAAGSRPPPVPWGAGAAARPQASGPVDYATLEKILNKIQCKDLRKIFMHPVTDLVVSEEQGRPASCPLLEHCTY